MASKPNFQALWVQMVGMAEEFGDPRLRAVLTNHEDRREYICRKLGVVSSGDVERLRAARQGRQNRRSP